jgi:uncharacterized protein (DUF983 family)
MPDAGNAVASTESRSALEAVKRGALGRCPRCETSKLFPKFLKPIAQCDACGQDWTPQQADDFPAYIAMITGRLLLPVIIALVKDAGLSVGTLMAIILSLAIIMMIALIQPSRGAIIAIQWWFSKYGFRRLPDKQD